MEFFRIHKTIPFMRYSHILNAISLVSFLVAVFWIFFHGLALSIEFTGGTQVVVQYPQAAPTEQIRNIIKDKLGVEAAVQNYGTALGCDDSYSDQGRRIFGPTGSGTRQRLAGERARCEAS